MRVAIVALGPSNFNYYQAAEAAGDMRDAFDEVWAVNSLGSVIHCDLVFHMDDVRVQEKRTDNAKVQSMLKWLKRTKKTVLTSRVHPDYPALEAYPLEDVINACGTAYFNSTVSYAVAYAIYYNVTRLSLFGIDFTWPNKHEAEMGRACVEYWVGRAMQRGIDVVVAPASTLLDTNIGRPLYGYDTIEPKIRYQNGSAHVSFEEKQTPTGEEIEERYNHG